MCGLFGVMTGGDSLSPQEIRLFEQLAIVNTLRGEFGAGTIMVPCDPKRKTKIARSQTDPLDYEYQVELRRMIKSVPMMLAGHTRSPTSGGFGEKHVHPFHMGKIIGMHNGTMEHIKGRKPDQKPKHKDDHVPTDSEMLFEAINQEGPEATISNSLGAYALVWVNEGNGSLNFLRNNDRPLSFATHEAYPGALFWSSEALALEFVLRRSAAAAPKVYRCPTDKLISFKLRNGSILPSFQGKLESLPKEKEVKLLPPPSHSPSLPAGSECVAVTAPDGRLDYHFRTYQENAVEEETLKLILASGCNTCGGSATWTDYKGGRTHWVAREEFICQECVTHNHTARLLVATAEATKH